MSLKNENSTIRLLIYILIFLILILFLLLFFIIPNIKDYKTSEVKLKSIESKIEDLTQRQKSLKDELKREEDENKNVLLKFNKNFNKTNFITFSKKYLNDVKLTKTKEQNLSNYYEYKFSAYTKNSSPKEFFKFIDSIKNYENLVKIKFPILLEKKGKKIYINLILDIYKMDKN